LIDTFKPQTIIVEDGPINVESKPKETLDGLTYPPTYDFSNELSGSEFDKFVTKFIIEAKEVYGINERH
jgi:hypothetical protein